VELGAVVVVPAREDLMPLHEVRFPLPASEVQRPYYSSRTPILGNDVLQSWMERVRKLGVRSLWLTSNPHDENVLPCAFSEFAREGIQRLLMIKLRSYAELDLADLLRFHCEKRNPVTEAQDDRGLLGVSLLDRLVLNAPDEKYGNPCAPGGMRTPYQFHGYAKRILSARERQDLVGDALNRACAMRPLGTEIREQVWVGEGVKLASSVRLIGPTYIGARTVVRAGATIGPFASVECDCVVDCGATVERSTILPNTYLAPGVLIRHELVDGEYLEDLTWAAVADLRPAGLGNRIQRREPLVHETAAGGSSRTSLAYSWNSVPLSSVSQPWMQVQL
jgi:carbonic anhydrase/acetyltransferase-like protein (isoleucine patch superfamily)